MKITRQLFAILLAVSFSLTAFSQESVDTSMIWGSAKDLQAFQAENQTVSQDAAADKAIQSNKNLEFDVANNGFTFAFGPGNGPGYGGTFIVKGYIYPGGTFDQMGTNSGINPDGSAEFPDLVIGEWTCRGWLARQKVGDPAGLTLQTYDFNTAQRGSETLASDGYEQANFNAFTRAITGGTGTYKHAKGTITMQTVGFNATGSPNFSFELN